MFSHFICSAGIPAAMIIIERMGMLSYRIIMGLSRNQFDVLVLLEAERKPLTQREIQDKMKCSLGTVNKLMRELTDLGYVSGGEITESGIGALQPYRAKRAVFIAAGFGSRLVPITLNTPKPLVRVHGKPIIEGLLDACVKAEIEDIVIVRGYLKEQFDVLKYKYPNIRFIDNDMYNEANNVSSALMAKDLLENCYVFEADLLISNPDIITKYHYTSDFLGIKKDRTDDWCFLVDSDNVIVKERIGGEDCWQMVGISYWNSEDGKKLAKDIETAFNRPGGKELYWEQVPLVEMNGSYKVKVRECFDEDIIEIDTFKELKAIDKTYDV